MRAVKWWRNRPFEEKAVLYGSFIGTVIARAIWH